MTKVFIFMLGERDTVDELLHWDVMSVHLSAESAQKEAEDYIASHPVTYPDYYAVAVVSREVIP